jgi:hypothetical protein
MQKRPPITDEMIKEACKKVADKHEIGDLTTLTDTFDEVHNGTQFAFALARKYGWEYGIEITNELIDDLDSLHYDVDKIHEEVVKQWFEDNDIQPPYPINTRIQEGVIEGIDQHGIARYMVRLYSTPADKKEWRLVNFEDAVPVL